MSRALRRGNSMCMCMCVCMCVLQLTSNLPLTLLHVSLSLVQKEISVNEREMMKGKDTEVAL